MDDDQAPGGFRHILGAFDTSGPCILAFPPRALVLPPDDLGRLILSGDYDAARRYTGHARFRISLWYSGQVDQAGKPQRILAIGPTARDDLFAGTTFAHEAHHFLNICGSPLGHLLHTSRTMLCLGLVNFLEEIRGEIDRTPTAIELPIPLASTPLGSVNDSFSNSLEGFRRDLIEPFVNVHRHLLGQLDISSAAIAASDDNAGIESLKTFYSRLDVSCGSHFAQYLEGIDPAAPPFVQLPDKSFIEFAGLQLAESIAWTGEILWLSWLGRMFHDTESQALLEMKINRLHSEVSVYVKRYRAAQLIASQVLSDRYTLTALMFASWMALLTPIDPRTLHLVHDYEMGWADMHPGLRFVRILEVIREEHIGVADDPYSFRPIAAERFDQVARILGWPMFIEMVNAMASKHEVESSSSLSWSSLSQVLDDPYRKIYSQINSLRQQNPWCDIMPGPEFLSEAELRVPVILTADGVAFDPQNESGFWIFATARIADLLIFGECDPSFDILFKDEKAQEGLEAICDRLGLSWRAVCETWRTLRKVAPR